MQWYYLDANQQQIPVDESELGNLLQDGTIGADTQLWNETMPEWQSAQSLWPDWFPDAGDSEQAVAAVGGGGGGKLRAPALVSKRSATVGLVKRPIQTSAGSGSGGSGGGGGKSQKLSGKTTQRTGSGKPGSRGGSSRAAEEDDEESNPELIKQLAKILGANAGWMKFVGVMSIIGGVVTCLTLVGALVGWLPIWLGVVLMKAANATETAAYKGYRDEMEEALTRVGFYFKLIGIVILSYIVLYGIAIAVVLSTGLLAFGAAASAVNGMPPGGVPTMTPPAIPLDPGISPATPATPEVPTPAPAPGLTPPAAPAPGTPAAPVPVAPAAPAPATPTAPAPAPATPTAPAPATPAAPAPAAPAAPK